MSKCTNDELEELIARHRELAPLVEERMNEVLDCKKHPMIHITHRIKTIDSIRGKMERKPNKYPKVSEMRDILGFRVICYLQRDIDRIAERMADGFRVDYQRSTDKRDLIEPTSFGYLSLHYICALPENEGYPEELCGLWFEVQIRTILQHAWAEIEHDLGYKTEFGVPRAVRRDFSRAASLLETADDLFERIKQRLTEYKKEVVSNIENDRADNLYLDNITITEFTAKSNKYQGLLREIAAITNANISEANPEGQLPQLAFLDIRTLGDLVALIDRERSTVLRLARDRLTGSELEELSSTVVYYYLYRAALIHSNYSPERIREFFALTSADSKLIERNTNSILAARLSQHSNENPSQ